MISLILAGILTGITASTITSTDISSSQLIMENSNGIKIYDADYEKLADLGFTESEIYNMTDDKYSRLMQMDIISTKSYNTIDKVSSTGNNSGTDTIYSKFEVEDDELLRIANLSLKDLNECSNSIGNDIAEQSYISNDEKKYVTSDTSKEMITYVSKVKINDDYKIFVKQNVKWNQDPSDRMHDLIVLNYTSNLRLDEANGYPNVEMNFNYLEKVYKKTGWKHKTPKYTIYTNDVNHTDTYNGSNQDKYNHSIGNYFGFGVDLPKNTSIDGSSSRFYLIEKHTYTNFNISMEATLSTNFKNMSGAELQTRYSHQSVDKEINWGEITFTTTPPFISYSYTGFLWIKHNSFDSGLFSSIILNF